MKGRQKKAPVAPPSDAATPFFARFLEDQHGDDAEAKVTARRPRAQATAKASSGGGSVKAVTLKYPSDRDEYILYPYYPAAATAKSMRQTLKYPSDRDEDIDPYYPVYLDAADAAKVANYKPKKNMKVRLTTKADDDDQVAS